MKAHKRRTVSFIVRMWAEPSVSGGDLCWRGQVEHVGSSELVNFQIPSALIALLTGRLSLLDSRDEQPDDGPDDGPNCGLENDEIS